MTKEINSSTDWETQRQRLNAEIQRLEAALVEAKEVTPVEGGDAASGKYAAKLREAERELEEASERWREERRRLNAEIDRLDEALQKARAEGRTADVVEAAGAARIQDIEARAKEEIQAVTEGWNTERSTLASRLEELHEAVAGSQSKVAEVEAMREELLSRLTAAERKRAELEEERNAAKVAHDQEQTALRRRLEESEQKGRAERERIEAEIREKLSMEYEWKVKELSFQKGQLEQKLKESGPRPSPETARRHPIPILLPRLHAQTSKSPKSRSTSTTPARPFRMSSARMSSDRGWKLTAAA